MVINVECIGKTFMFRSGEKVERNLKNLTTQRLTKGVTKYVLGKVKSIITYNSSRRAPIATII